MTTAYDPANQYEIKVWDVEFRRDPARRCRAREAGRQGRARRDHLARSRARVPRAQARDLRCAVGSGPERGARVEAHLAQRHQRVTGGRVGALLGALGHDLHVAVRGEGLSSTMSRYLVERIERHPLIDVRLRTEVTAVHADAGHLAAVTFTDDEGRSETVPGGRLEREPVVGRPWDHVEMRVLDLLACRRLIHEKGGGIAGEANEKEHRGHHAPDDEEGVQQPSQEKTRHPGPLLRQRHSAEVHVELGQGREVDHPRAVRIDLDLLVERHDGSPVADVSLEVGEQREARRPSIPGGYVREEQRRDATRIVRRESFQHGP